MNRGNQPNKGQHSVGLHDNSKRYKIMPLVVMAKGKRVPEEDILKNVGNQTILVITDFHLKISFLFSTKSHTGLEQHEDE